MEEDTDDEGHEEEEDEYVLLGSLGYLYGIHICMIFFVLNVNQAKYGIILQ